jgi:hypothetical protein
MQSFFTSLGLPGYFMTLIIASFIGALAANAINGRR